jgi:CNT family concentrative nucleoside transporter
MCVMVAGFANIASGVLGVYTEWLQPYVKDVGGHLAAACFVSAPASILISKLLVPETDTPQTVGGVQFKIQRVDANVIDAAARGTAEGVQLAINVGAMLIAFTALVAMLNALLGWASVATHLADKDTPYTLQGIFGFVLAPLAWLAGVPWSDARDVGSLLGVKTVLNELIAYSEMKDRFAADPHFLHPRSALLATYALCGFANFASIGIQVGGIGLMAPDRRAELSRLGLLAMLGGGLASLMAAAVIGVLV